MIKAFIFDLDGTLADTELLHYRTWKAVLEENGVAEFTFDAFLNYVGTSNEKVARDYIDSDGIVKSVEELIERKQQLYMEIIGEIQLYEGVVEILETFHDKVQMAVASSSHYKEVSAILAVHNISSFFEYVIGGDMVLKRKPDPEIYLKTLEELGVSAQESIAFEDTNFGITAVKDAGIYGIAVPNVYTKNHDFSRANQVLPSLSDFNDDLFIEINIRSDRFNSHL